MQINTFLEQCVALGHILKVVVFGTWKWPPSSFRPVAISGLLYRRLNVLWGLITWSCDNGNNPIVFFL